jgi:hypothetical protein
MHVHAWPRKFNLRLAAHPQGVLVAGLQGVKHKTAGHFMKPAGSFSEYYGAGI